MRTKTQQYFVNKELTEESDRKRVARRTTAALVVTEREEDNSISSELGA
jgi:hypothetical protein